MKIVSLLRDCPFYQVVSEIQTKRGRKVIQNIQSPINGWDLFLFFSFSKISLINILPKIFFNFSSTFLKCNDDGAGWDNGGKGGLQMRDLDKKLLPEKE